MREIRDLPLNAELVTLSACDTAQGRLLEEEGIANLEEAFLLAGAKTVIASLWGQDDTYTLALMKHFYRHLGDGQDKGSALRQAKLDLLGEFGEQALPFYWAGFTMVGEGSGVIRHLCRKYGPGRRSESHPESVSRTDFKFRIRYPLG